MPAEALLEPSLCPGIDEPAAVNLLLDVDPAGFGQGVTATRHGDLLGRQVAQDRLAPQRVEVDAEVPERCR
ncbi:MAG: hypothetical protein KY469_15870 [Actinobacteria bacterium]|nr:hypothetical protein [Actinomycetota bacterium]